MANYFILKEDSDRERAINFIRTVDLTKPKKISCVNYVKDRSAEQNKLQMFWIKAATIELDGETFEELRSRCKLLFGIPILRRDNDRFCRIYDKIIKPLEYEEKIEYIAVFDFAVTRLMNVKQMMEYTDRIAQYFSEQGVYLPIPEDMQRNY